MVGLLPFLTGPERDKIINYLKDKPDYCFKSMRYPAPHFGGGWHLHYKDQPLSEDQLITLFKQHFPEQEISYYK
jgi:hypothetical protein